MLKDITIGQHFPGNSPIHRFDPRLKIAVVVLYVAVVFLSTNFPGLIMCGAAVLAAYAVAGIPLRLLAKSIKPILPLIFFTVVLNLFFIRDSGRPLVAFLGLKIYKSGVLFCIVMVCRILFLICGTSLLTYTTGPISLTDGLESLMKPLTFIKFPVHEMAMIMSIAMRFIPVLIEETDKIMSAQKSRGALLDSGSFKDRVKAMVPILVPLFISAFRRALDLANAMECRCYRGGRGRTRLRRLKVGGSDLVTGGVCMAVFACILVMKNFFVRVI